MHFTNFILLLFSLFIHLQVSIAALFFTPSPIRGLIHQSLCRLQNATTSSKEALVKAYSLYALFRNTLFLLKISYLGLSTFFFFLCVRYFEQVRRLRLTIVTG